VKIASLDNLLFLLLIAAAALFQLLSKAVTKAGKSKSDKTSTPQRPPTPPQVGRAPTKSTDADRIRKFLEALGQPPTTTPPPPVARRTDVPPRRLAPVQPPPVVIPRAWRLPREQRTQPDASQRESPSPKPPRHVEFVRPVVPAPVTPAFEIYEGALGVELEPPAIVKTSVGIDTAAARPIAKEQDVKKDIATLLASSSGLRNAIILREIFGPPRSLQPLDVIGSA
jgi:hypothetical protein